MSGPDYCQRRGVNRHRPAGCQGACQTGNVSGAKLENIAADCSWVCFLSHQFNNNTVLIIKQYNQSIITFAECNFYNNNNYNNNRFHILLIIISAV